MIESTATKRLLLIALSLGLITLVVGGWQYLPISCPVQSEWGMVGC